MRTSTTLSEKQDSNAEDNVVRHPKHIDEPNLTSRTKEKVMRGEISVGYKNKENSLVGHTYEFDTDGNIINDYKREEEEDFLNEQL